MHTSSPKTFLPLLAGFAISIAGCVRSEIEPMSEDTTPKPVQIDVAKAVPDRAPGDWRVLRVGGMPEHEVTVQPGQTKAGDAVPYYRAGEARLSAALPEGYAPPTPPGAIELKVYEAYRQAVVETDGGQGAGFWPLFRHIQKRDIAMTAPVVMTGEMAGGDEDSSTMAFLYRSTEQGETGEAERDIVVEDTPRTTVLATAFVGRERTETLNRMKDTLIEWIDAQPYDSEGRWEADGTPRLLGYNGPDRPRSKRWWEYQIPVKWVESGE